MALKGLDIFKLTPKKNCKECGSPTCMAFAMKVAQGAVPIEKCPYMSEDALATLSEATAPLMKTLEVGTGDNAHKLGGETVLFRHEKTLVNKNLFAGLLCSKMTDEEIDAKIADFEKVDYERIGEREYVELLYLHYAGNGADKYTALVEKAVKANRALVLDCGDAEVAKAALAICKDLKPILKRAKEQLDAGATYLDVNIGPAENDGEELMKWAVKLLQENFDNVPLALDTANRKAIEAGISVYNRSKGKPIVNSADAGSRIENIDLAAANDAIVIALCSADGIAADNDERMVHCQNLLERGLSLGMESEDLWFDPLFLVIKGMQDKQMEVLEAIKMFSDMGLNSTGGLSNNSNGMPKHIRPIMDATMVAMCMMQGLTSAIVNPCDQRLMETIKSADVIKNNTLYADSYLEL